MFKIPRKTKKVGTITALRKRVTKSYTKQKKLSAKKRKARTKKSEKKYDAELKRVKNERAVLNKKIKLQKQKDSLQKARRKNSKSWQLLNKAIKELK